MFYGIFLLLIPYYELIFRISTTKDLSPLSLLISFLFSAGYSALIALIARPFEKQKANRLMTGILLFIIPVLYLVEFFVYRSFKVFYDVNTVINGAGGVAAGFKADVGRLVFCYDGISRIVLFLLPFLIYVIFIRRKDPAKRHGLKAVLPLLLTGLILIFSSRAIVSRNEILKNMYFDEYNFQSIVESLGFGTGVRLDVVKMIKGDDDELGFEFGGGFDTGSNTSFRQSFTDLIDNADPVKKETFEGYVSDIKNASSDGTVIASRIELPSPEDILPEDPGPLVADATLPDETEPNEPSAENADIIEPEEESVPEEPEGPVSFNDPAEYGVNVLDIDFTALAETTSGKAKELDQYVASITPSSKNRYTGLFKGKNLIFFSAEAFSGDIIDPELTPTLYRLSTKGIQIADYYQPAIAGTTGGEYANLFGLIPSNGGKSMKQMTNQNTWITIGNRLNDEGYYGRTFHDNSGDVYGRNQTHNRLGYSDGFMALGSGMEEFLSSSGFPQSDLEMMQGTLPTYIDKQPFNVYYMTVSGHGQYGRGINRMSAKNYDRVSDLPYSEIVKCYIANNMELEDALTYTVNALEEAGIADDTVIVLGADHFPYSLDNDAALGHMPNLSELYGYNVTNYIERDHNRLIIWSGCLEDMDPIVVDDPVFSLDILPTLCNLFGVEFDSRLLPGRDIFSDKDALIFTGGYDWKTSLGTYIAAKNVFTPASPDTEIPEDYVNTIKADVRNRMTYCKGVLSCDYFNHVFGPPN